MKDNEIKREQKLEKKPIRKEDCKLTKEEEIQARKDRDEKRIKNPNSPFTKKMNEEFLDDREEEILKECYYEIINLLKKYCDLKEKNYHIIALWIIGTYIHNEFETYPYLFLNAGKGSGKTRLLRLITNIAHNGKMVGSLTEAVLFRTAKGRTFGIDEFESVGSEGKSNLRELLNSAYKRGLTIERVKKQKTEEGEDYIVEEYIVYTPIVMANIWGMESVLGDRCITLIIEKSKKRLTKLIEIYDRDERIIQINKKFELIKKALSKLVKNKDMAKNWNDFIRGKSKITDSKTLSFFKNIDETGIEGRNLELLLPLLFVSYMIDDKTLNETLIVSKEIVKEREEEDYYEDRDKALIRFIDSMIKQQNLDYSTWIRNTRITSEFKTYLGEGDLDNINPKTIGRALKRLNLISEKRRASEGIELKLNIPKIQEKVR
jgi:hypothetical protein|tara:strand:+ start:460 stop:1758 length:1299 start_codon:yes stop_codon:yes gene_type:complete